MFAHPSAGEYAQRQVGRLPDNVYIIGSKDVNHPGTLAEVIGEILLASPRPREGQGSADRT